MEEGCGGRHDGALGSAIASPTDLFKVRMGAWEGKPKPLRWHIRTTVQEEGFFGLYRGVQTTIVRAMLLNAVKMSSYDHIKHELCLKYLGLSDGLATRFGASVATGLLVALSTAPVDLCRTRIMDSPKGTYRGMVHCAMDTVKNEGALSLYKGFLPQWYRFGPYAIIQFLVWETLRDMSGYSGI